MAAPLDELWRYRLSLWQTVEAHAAILSERDEEALSGAALKTGREGQVAQAFAAFIGADKLKQPMRDPPDFQALKGDLLYQCEVTEVADRGGGLTSDQARAEIARLAAKKAHDRYDRAGTRVLIIYVNAELDGADAGSLVAAATKASEAFAEVWLLCRGEWLRV